MSSDHTIEPSSPANLLDEMLAQFRSEYVKEHGEEPPKEVMVNMRMVLLKGAAREKREENREIYDALAKE